MPPPNKENPVNKDHTWLIKQYNLKIKTIFCLSFGLPLFTGLTVWRNSFGKKPPFRKDLCLSSIVNNCLHKLRCSFSHLLGWKHPYLTWSSCYDLIFCVNYDKVLTHILMSVPLRTSTWNHEDLNLFHRDILR